MKRERIKMRGSRRKRAGYPVKDKGIREFGPSCLSLPQHEIFHEGRMIKIRSVSQVRRSDGAPLYREPSHATRNNEEYISPKRRRAA